MDAIYQYFVSGIWTQRFRPELFFTWSPGSIDTNESTIQKAFPKGNILELNNSHHVWSLAFLVPYIQFKIDRYLIPRRDKVARL